MNHHSVSACPRNLFVLLLLPLLLLGCENDNSSTGDTSKYLESQRVTLDNKPGWVTTNSVATALSISPLTATVSAIDDTLVFTASGGTPPYEWTVANIAVGTITVVDGNPCIYTCKQLKKNSVWVTDHKGTVKAATIDPATP